MKNKQIFYGGVHQVCAGNVVIGSGNSRVAGGDMHNTIITGGSRVARYTYNEGDENNSDESSSPAGCTRGSGNRVVQGRTVQPFRRIRLSGIGQLVITRGDCRVLVTFDDNLLDHIVTDSDGETLTISAKGSFSCSAQPAIAIKCPNVDAVKVDGAGSVELEDVTDVKLKVKLSGAGDVTATGRVAHLDVRLSGAGHLVASSLESRTCDIDASGAAMAAVNVSESIDVDVSGACEVKVLGNPPQRHVRESGAGSVKFK